MFQVTREIEFCYGHRLLDYQGKCRYLHGHNGRLLVTFQAESLDRLGMVLDFADIKRTVQHWLEANLDHRMILHRDDPAVPVLQSLGEPVYIVGFNPTAENIARMIFDFIQSQGMPVVQTELWETARCSAVYRP